MTCWNDILGHSQQVTMFRHALRQNRLAHTYLFLGPEGIGKRRFATTLAQCLFCERFAEIDLECCGDCPSCRQMRAGTYPDYYEVCPPEGKAEFHLDQFLGSKERRGREGLCYDLSLRPMSGHRKVAIIDEADLLNVESANALLKTLEEPPSHVLMILIATNEDRLLPTIRSRCQQIRFQPLSEAHLTQLLLEQSVVENEAEAALLATISAGSLAVAGRLQNPELQGIRRQLYNALAKLKLDSYQLRTQIWAKIEEAGTDNQSQRELAGWAVQFVIEFLREMLRNLAGSGDGRIAQAVAISTRLDPQSDRNFDVLEQLLDCCLTTLTQINARVSLAICLENWFERLGRLYGDFVLLPTETHLTR